MQAGDVGISSEVRAAVPDHSLALIGEVFSERIRRQPDAQQAAADATLIVEAVNALPALLDAVGDIEMTVGIYEELAAGIRASRDPRVMREREGAIASLGETLAAKVRTALIRLDGAS